MTEAAEDIGGVLAAASTDGETNEASAPAMRMPLATSIAASLLPTRGTLSLTLPRARPSFWPGPLPVATDVPARRSIEEAAPSCRLPLAEVSSIMARFGLSMILP